MYFEFTDLNVKDNLCAWCTCTQINIYAHKKISLMKKSKKFQDTELIAKRSSFIALMEIHVDSLNFLKKIKL